MRFNDLVSGAMLIAAALLVIVLTSKFPDFPGQNYGPAVFPRLLAVLLILCGVMMMIRGFAAWRAGEPLADMPSWARDPANVVSALLVLGAALAYILVLDAVGFVPLTIVVLLVLFLWFKVRVPVAVVTALVAAFGVNWFFASLMRVPLPRGLMDWIL
ncbi:tripartite tricarboxylate transporter TctB family protein [Phreatobacter cathodiphilus]|uniref:Tripartite tricarboxylate transporter TctB family protein n=1 Tax=Phreatobacter cathodiphilus TaxID=1868589 RepID=A0A2S0N790_9HYPH|nr:tripartite tricarboxylate transporter TctB family protein [Phreatobacter cathodiphilus]AVO44008.1 tripartite tricarboxylate transporter TctB family protein [Phreatobacter cathodiphilus]